MKHRNRFGTRGLVSGLAISVATLSLVAGCEGVLGLNGDDSGERSRNSSGDGDGLGGDGDGDGDQALGVGVIEYEAGLAPTPLARLTNSEFLASAEALLELPANSPELEGVRATLVAEPLIGGLKNDSKTQLLKQLTVASFSNIASAATDAFLGGVTSNAGLLELLGCAAGADLSTCTKEFGAQLIERGFRRPATSGEADGVNELIDQLDALFAEKASDPASFDSNVLRLRTLVRYVLLSPDYLLLVEKGQSSGEATEPRPLTSYEIATRMSYFLVGSLPDEALLAAAEADTLTDPAVRLEHADRLLNGAGGQSRIREALLGWLGVDEGAVDQASLDTLSDFIDTWFGSGQPFSDFYQAPVSVAHLDGSESDENFGVLGLNAFLGSHTSYPTPAFITRGVFLVERLLCLALPADIPAEALEAGATTDLEVFEVHDQQPCATCHQYFDNWGAALHQFDAETGLFVPGPSVLGSGFELLDPDGVIGVADGVEDLGAVVGESDRGQSCMAELWYRSSRRRSLDPSGADDGNVDQLVSDWNESGDTSLKSLLRTIVSTEDFATFYP